MLLLLFFFFKENSFETLVQEFQSALYQHYDEEDQCPLYNPTVMRDFVQEHSPGLFDMILNSILKPETSKDRRYLQEQRTVVLLHIIAYFRYQILLQIIFLHLEVFNCIITCSIVTCSITFNRSQKTSQLQKDMGTFLNNHGVSRSAVNSGPVLGYSVAPRTIDRQNHQLRKDYPTLLHSKIKHATQVCFACFINQTCNNNNNNLY